MTEFGWIPVRAQRFWHGTAEDAWQPHVGACLSDNEEAAASYAAEKEGGYVLRVELEASPLLCLALTDDPEDLWADDYATNEQFVEALRRQEDDPTLDPDVVTYVDMPPNNDGSEFTCVRLLTDAAADACRVVD